MTLEELYIFFENVIIEKYNRKLDYIDSQIYLYKMVLADFQKGKVSRLGKKVIYEKYQYELTKDNLGRFAGTIATDLAIFQNNLNILLGYKYKCFQVLNCIRYKQVFFSYLMEFIKEELKKENITGVKLIETFENLRNHNLKIKSEGKISGNILTKVTNILNSGYEKIIIEPKEYSAKVYAHIDHLIQLIDSNKFDIVNNNLELDYFTIAEQVFILKKILKHYQDKILQLVEMLKTEDFYFDSETLKTIINEHTNYLNRYLFVRGKLDEIEKSFPLEKEPLIIDDNPKIIEVMDNNKIYYSTNSWNSTKCYFVKDLMDIREESLATILSLIEEFKAGDRSKIKIISDALEIKYDQIRIILKNIKANNYSLMGVFIKKDNNDRLAYNNILNRPMAEINDLYSEQVEAFYQEYIANNKRNGSRS